MNESMHWGFGGAGIWLIILILAVVAIFFYARKDRGPHADSPMDILKDRYAKGEIEQEEFERKKKELQES